MSDVVLSVNNLSKRYRIGAEAEEHDTLMGVLSSWVKSPLENYRRVKRLSAFGEDGKADDIIWALKDVSFEVERGEVVGVIGRNGAGKSTLLKILSRITEPTRGHAEIKGRVSSLLEVGTGFHPELTGRENVYLNGTILGMTRAEVDRKFDEIVDFSGVETFIDTPVKRYSSGMKVRLAFAVAAHLEPEILLIDEVLAVGDAGFQKKCLGKMEEIAGKGRTVLFVSHRMASVESLTERTIVLEGGRVYRDAATIDAIDTYLSLTGEQARAKGNHIKAVAIGPADNALKNGPPDNESVVKTGDAIAVDIVIDPKNRTIRDAQVGIGVHTTLGRRLFTVGTYYSDTEQLCIGEKCVVRCITQEQFLRPGSYPLKIALSSKEEGLIEAIENVYTLNIQPRDIFGNGKIPTKKQGTLMVRSEWSKVNAVSAAEGQRELR